MIRIYNIIGNTLSVCSCLEWFLFGILLGQNSSYIVIHSVSSASVKHLRSCWASLLWIDVYYLNQNPEIILWSGALQLTILLRVCPKNSRYISASGFSSIPWNSFFIFVLFLSASGWFNCLHSFLVYSFVEITFVFFLMFFFFLYSWSLCGGYFLSLRSFMNVSLANFFLLGSFVAVFFQLFHSFAFSSVFPKVFLRPLLRVFWNFLLVSFSTYLLFLCPFTIPRLATKFAADYLYSNVNFSHNFHCHFHVVYLSCCDECAWFCYVVASSIFYFILPAFYFYTLVACSVIFRISIPENNPYFRIILAWLPSI